MFKVVHDMINRYLHFILQNKFQYLGVFLFKVLKIVYKMDFIKETLPRKSKYHQKVLKFKMTSPFSQI